MESGSSARTTDYSGWAAFAGIVMFIVGSLDALWVSARFSTTTSSWLVATERSWPTSQPGAGFT